MKKFRTGSKVFVTKRQIAAYSTLIPVQKFLLAVTFIKSDNISYVFN